jgi:hypothetical protein
MPTVTEMFDREKGRYPKPVVTASGVTAERHFRVDTGNPETVLDLIGTAIPGIGSPWSPSRPDVAAVSVEPEFQGGSDDATGVGGHHFVKVSYASISMGQSVTSAPVGASWCEVVGSTQQVAVTASATGQPIPQSAGLNAEANTCEIVVTSVKANFNALRDFQAIQNRINAGAVVFPAVRGLLGSSFTAQPGELLARSVRVNAVNDEKCHLVYTFGIAPLLPVDPAQPNGARASSWIRRYRKTDAAGNPVGAWLLEDVQGVAVYPAAGVLW